MCSPLGLSLVRVDQVSVQWGTCLVMGQRESESLVHFPGNRYPLIIEFGLSQVKVQMGGPTKQTICETGAPSTSIFREKSHDVYMTFVLVSPTVINDYGLFLLPCVVCYRSGRSHIQKQQEPIGRCDGGSSRRPLCLSRRSRKTEGVLPPSRLQFSRISSFIRVSIKLFNIDQF